MEYDLDDMEDEECSAQALFDSLAYLYNAALRAGYNMPAHLIGVAAEATLDIIKEQERTKGTYIGGNGHHRLADFLARDIFLPGQANDDVEPR